jgi:hypothetical protein
MPSPSAGQHVDRRPTRAGDVAVDAESFERESPDGDRGSGAVVVLDVREFDTIPVDPGGGG